MSSSDEPIAFTKEGKPIFDNTPTVVAVAIVNTFGNVLIIRRNTNPGMGLFALPGGYHMRGETWQEAGAREVQEEVGMDIDPKRIKLMFMETDSDGNNVVLAKYEMNADESVKPKINKKEVIAASWVNKNDDPVSFPIMSSWAFELHYNAACTCND